MSNSSLAEAIEQACLRLEEGSVRTEADVRNIIVNPILGRLGWNLADPGSTKREYAVTGRKRFFFDYALLSGGGAVAAVIEAKAPGQMDENARDQLLLYR